MQYKLIQRAPAERRYSLLGFDLRHLIYRTAMQIDVSGRIGYAHSLTGVDFYRHIAARGTALMQEIGVDFIDADVSASHQHLIERALGDDYKVERLGESAHLGIDLIRIRITPK